MPNEAAPSSFPMIRTDLFFFFGLIASFASGLALLRMMPRGGLWWGRVLHLLVSAGQFWIALIYLLVLMDVLSSATYSQFAYPVSIVILSPGWVIWLTHGR